MELSYTKLAELLLFTNFGHVSHKAAGKCYQSLVQQAVAAGVVLGWLATTELLFWLAVRAEVLTVL